MSRVIVKNLPQKCSEEKLRELFSSCGEVTDVRLMRTRTGNSRKFGFIGFNSAKQAEQALRQFNKTYIGAAKIEVEEAKPYGDYTLARPWSKYSKGSSTHKEISVSKEGGAEEPGEERTQLGEMIKEYEELEDDPEFQEFLDIHKHKSKVKTWSDNVVAPGKEEGCGKEGSGQENEDRAVKKTFKGDVTDEGHSSEGDEEEEDPVTSLNTSDLGYLKSKVVKHECDDIPLVLGKSNADTDAVPAPQVIATTPYTVKMLGLPFRAGKKDVHTFFHPLKVVAVRFTQDSQGRPSGRGYVDFECEEDLKKALKRNRDCIFHRYIELFRDEFSEAKGGHVPEEKNTGEKLKPWELKAGLGGEAESITESGRIFVRNLSFSTQEEQLSELFGKYGPLTEVTIPLDKTTNKSTGLGFVTFMFPEHAAKAYQELDGQIFQGRLLHLLPARARRGQGEGHLNQLGSFKKSKEVMMRLEAASSHNWNSLFLGANAVVDVMARKYLTEKSEILDQSSSGSSAAVKVALGETQIVRETREFLQLHGVNLEVFEQAKPKRSKSVIVVKNLASGYTSSEIAKLFEPFGQLLQVIMPPAGISALVEFAEKSQAKKAFSKLAYTSFKHLPLYLEWAPVDVLAKSAQHTVPESDSSEEKSGVKVEEEELNTGSVFVKNLNFSTSEASLKELFSGIGEVRSINIARKKNPKEPAMPLSMGFGFVEYKSESTATEAIKQLQHSELDGHVLELKLSHHSKTRVASAARKVAKLTQQKSAKILVRNVPFEASKQEIKDLFSTFGTLKIVRLPKKLSAGSGEHRGFGFVEFVTKQDAKRAFESLCHSTHLYGRRLVLEWAEQEESLEAIRKRTAEHFHGFKIPTSKRTKSHEQILINTLEKS